MTPLTLAAVAALGWAATLVPRPAAAAPPAAPAEIDAIPLTTIDGKTVKLGDPAFAGHALLIVNTASRCGFTSQYAGLTKMYETYRGQGLIVLGFPSNDFGGQEPGSNAEIQQFCSKKFKVSFPLFAKAPVSGDAIQPLYRALVAAAPSHEAVAWNFEKFLLDRRHQVVARYRSQVTPEGPELATAVEMALKP